MTSVAKLDDKQQTSDNANSTSGDTETATTAESATATKNETAATATIDNLNKTIESLRHDLDNAKSEVNVLAFRILTIKSTLKGLYHRCEFRVCVMFNRRL